MGGKDVLAAIISAAPYVVALIVVIIAIYAVLKKYKFSVPAIVSVIDKIAEMPNISEVCKDIINQIYLNYIPDEYFGKLPEYYSRIPKQFRELFYDYIKSAWTGYVNEGIKYEVSQIINQYDFKIEQVRNISDGVLALLGYDDDYIIEMIRDRAHKKEEPPSEEDAGEISKGMTDEL